MNNAHFMNFHGDSSVSLNHLSKDWALRSEIMLKGMRWEGDILKPAGFTPELIDWEYCVHYSSKFQPVFFFTTDAITLSFPLLLKTYFALLALMMPKWVLSSHSFFLLSFIYYLLSAQILNQWWFLFGINSIACLVILIILVKIAMSHLLATRWILVVASVVCARSLIVLLFIKCIIHMINCLLIICCLFFFCEGRFIDLSHDNW